jgi:cell wall-associated NlpC family hydrolase
MGASFTSQNERKCLSYKKFLRLTTQARVRILRAMLKTRPRFACLARRTVSCLILAGSIGAACAGPADFAPLPPAVAASAAADAVSRFLIDRGLIGAAPAAPAGEGGFVSQVRDKASDMVVTAMNFLGVRYQRGGNDADAGFDCSGFTRQVFETSLGLVLPRRADEQAKAAGLVKVKKDELQPGDLVFFNTLRRTFSHVGIYVGDGKFIHSPKPGGEVRVESMNFAYWAKRFTGARRAEPLADQAAAETRQPPPALVQTLAPAHALR